MKSAPLRILTFAAATGNALPYLAKDMADAFIRLGQVVGLFDLSYLTHKREKIGQVLFRAWQGFKPDLIFTLDTIGLVPELFDRLKIPVCSWFVDNPLFSSHILLPYKPNYHLFIWDRGYFKDLQGAGYHDLHYLPLATNPNIFKKLTLSSSELKRYGANLSFVGASSFSVGFREKREKLSAVFSEDVMEALIERHARDPSKPITHYLAELKWADDPQALALFNKKHRGELTALEFESMTRYRRKVIETVADFGVDVWGDEGWIEAASDKIRYRGRIEYHQEAPKLYNAAAVNLNITKSQLLTTINQRLFDVSACAAFVLSDYRSDLVELFEPGQEVVFYRTIEELPSLVDYYLRHPEEREKIAARACQRVLAQHTFIHRAQEVLAKMREVM
ncbi:MAG: glycosyltransferase [bacterium]